MCKNRRFKASLVILLMIMGILSFKLIFLVNKINWIKSRGSINITRDKNVVNIEKYGYSDILDVLRKNSDFEVKSINMSSEDICNTQVEYNGNIKSLYTSLYALNESKNFLTINSININKEVKTITISIDFKKNK